MKKNGLKVLAPLIALAALLALGTAVYPALSDRTLRQTAQATEAPQATETPQVTEAPQTTEAPQATEASQATEAPQATETPQTAQPSETPQPQESTPTPEAQETPEVAGPAYKPMAKDFTVYDGEGNAVTLASRRGKPVLVNFFASWCGPCRQEMPALDAAYRAHGEEIEFMMIDLCGGGSDDPADALALCKELGCAFAPLFDEDNSAAATYAVRAIPTTLLVAPDGELLETQVGTMSEAAVSQKIERLLSTIQ